MVRTSSIETRGAAPDDAPVAGPSYERDETYYWTGNVSFLVERKKFCVPQYPFIVASDYFTEKYGLTKTETSNECIDLPEDVSASQFKILLKALLPIHTTSMSTTFTKDEWLSILPLATQWYFHDLRKFAVEHLEGQLTHVEKIRFGRIGYVSRWVLEGYAGLVLKDEVISQSEADTVGNRCANGLWMTRFLASKVEGDDAKKREFVDQELRKLYSEEITSIEVREAEHRTRTEVEQLQKEEEDRRREEQERLKAEREEEERKAKDQEGANPQ